MTNLSDTEMSLVAGEAIGSPRVIMMVDGEAFLFEPSDETNLPRLIGVSLNSAHFIDTVRVAVRVARTGLVTSAGSFIANTVYYAGAAGVLISSVPSSGIIVRIGIAVSANLLALEMSEPLILS